MAAVIPAPPAPIITISLGILPVCVQHRDIRARLFQGVGGGGNDGRAGHSGAAHRIHVWRLRVHDGHGHLFCGNPAQFGRFTGRVNQYGFNLVFAHPDSHLHRHKNALCFRGIGSGGKQGLLRLCLGKRRGGNQQHGKRKQKA